MRLKQPRYFLREDNKYFIYVEKNRIKHYNKKNRKKKDFFSNVSLLTL